jgi:Lrp/AsnC family transcriptional regulator, leucine-responsive regulatory protein
MMLDKIDCELLSILQQQGRTKRNELAEKVGLSLPAVSERLRKLEEEKIIQGYYTRLDHKRLGKDITAFVVVTVDSSKHFPTFIEHIQKSDDIQECHSITGNGTHLLKVRTENTTGLEKLLAKIQSWPGVQKTTTNLVLSTHKESTYIKIEEHKQTSQ